MISILILTLNEERNIADCLKTCLWSDDVHVLDSYSSDKTVEIAESMGARIWYRKFDSFAQHQNWALQNISFKYPWVFYFDADERITERLASSMQAAVAADTASVAFRVERRDFFLGTWLKHVQMTAHYERLFQPGKMRYERLGHCISRPDGLVGDVEGYLDHYPFSKGIAEWIQKHNFYSTQEAEQSVMAPSRKHMLHAIFFPKETADRKSGLKELYYRMPFRPFLKFFVMYFVKLGFLDGRAGFTYSVLIAFYEYMIVLKTRELRNGMKRT